MNGYIINTHPVWFIKFVENLKNRRDIVFWNKSARLPAESITKGTCLFHRLTGSKKIEGISVVKSIEVMPIGEAWRKYSTDLGFESIEKLVQVSSKMEGDTNFSGEMSPILCIVLTDLFQCSLDIITDLPKMGISFGNFPNLPTVGKLLSEPDTLKLLTRVSYPGILEKKYFILRTGGGGYDDQKGTLYHFRQGIPGYLQLSSAQKKAEFVYLENGHFRGTGDIGEIVSKIENGVTNYYATIENYSDLQQPIPASSVEDKISRQLTQAGIMEITYADFNTILHLTKVNSKVKVAEQGKPDDPIVTGPLNLRPELIKTELSVTEELLLQMCAALNSNSHIIITGPVGTGKTSFSEDVCKAGEENKYCNGYVLTTASSDWTTFDTIGGYMPTDGNRLMFEEGKFLEAIRQNRWLIIDEINRADIDKAFGQLFSVLSGQSVELPFKHSNGKTLSIQTTMENGSYFDEETATYRVGKNWRIIATMNIYDMNFLFEMSYAFMRRFAFLYMDLPEKFPELIQLWCRERNLSQKTVGRLVKLTILAGRKLGPAITKDIVEYLKFRGDGEIELAEAIIGYVLPQLEGLEKEKIQTAWNQLATEFDDKKVPNTKILPIMTEITGVNLTPIM
jgi:MoxR-like ATPase